MKGLTHKRSILGLLCALVLGMIMLIPTEVEAAQLTVTSTSRKNYTAVANGETILVTLSGATTNTNMMGKPSWITVSGSSSSYKLVVAKNTAKSSRTGDVVFRAGNKVFTVRITQNGAPTTVTVKFNNNGGTGKVPNKSYTIGKAYSKLPAGPAAPKGMKFDGWYTKKSGGTKVTTKTKASASVSVLYAHYTGKTYTIRFDSQGGTKAFVKNVKYGGKYGKLETPKKYGYDFDGWYTAAKGGTKITSKSDVKTAANHTLYAHWTPKKRYTVTMVSGDKEEKYEVFKGDKFTLPRGYSKNDGEFAGWNRYYPGGFIIYNRAEYQPGDQIIVNSDMKFVPFYKHIDIPDKISSFN